MAIILGDLRMILQTSSISVRAQEEDCPCQTQLGWQAGDQVFWPVPAYGEQVARANLFSHFLNYNVPTLCPDAGDWSWALDHRVVAAEQRRRDRVKSVHGVALYLPGLRNAK